MLQTNTNYIFHIVICHLIENRVNGLLVNFIVGRTKACGKLYSHANYLSATLRLKSLILRESITVASVRPDPSAIGKQTVWILSVHYHS